MSKNIAIIGASYLQLPLIEKAKSMGYTTHVFAWAAGDVGESSGDYFYPISIIEKELITQKCREIGICGICSIASDLASATVNYVAVKLGLTGNSLEATERSTNKYYMRKTFEEHGDPGPVCIRIDENTDIDTLDITYPVIIKPTDRSGSRGVYKVENVAELKKYLKKTLSEGFEKKAIVEKFCKGTEYSVEYISYKGCHSFLALTLKYTTNAPHFIETGHLQPAPVDEKTMEHIKKTVEHALDSLGIEYGASHSEIKIDDEGNIKIIEIGGRMGGDCIGSDLVYYSAGYDFVKMVIDIACGKAPDLSRHSDTFPVESVFIFDNDDIAEFEKIKAEEPDRIIKVLFYAPENIGYTTDSSNRAGCYIRKYKKQE